MKLLSPTTTVSERYTIDHYLRVTISALPDRVFQNPLLASVYIAVHRNEDKVMYPQEFGLSHNQITRLLVALKAADCSS